MNGTDVRDDVLTRQDALDVQRRWAAGDLATLETALVSTLEDISEAAYAAAWHVDTSFAVWDLLHGRRDGWGQAPRHELKVELGRLARIIEITGLWAVWGPDGPAPVPLVEWAEHVDVLGARHEHVGDAEQLALLAHAGQTDHAGVPYIGHPRRVAARLTDPLWRTVALLHDVLEDTHVGVDDLAARRIPPRAIDAVVALTRLPREPYRDYLGRVAHDPIATQVKRADVADNLDPARLSLLPAATADRLAAKYTTALSDLAAFRLKARQTA